MTINRIRKLSSLSNGEERHLRLHFSGNGENNQLGHVNEVASVAKDHTAGPEDHRTPEHQEEKRLRVVLVRKERSCAKHRHSKQQDRWELWKIIKFTLIDCFQRERERAADC